MELIFKNKFKINELYPKTKLEMLKNDGIALILDIPLITGKCETIVLEFSKKEKDLKLHIEELKNYIKKIIKK